jgi:hypothetical protein
LSVRNFVHNLGNVEKKLNESFVRPRMLKQTDRGNPEQVAQLVKECDKLCRIVAASRKRAEANAKKERMH